MKYSFSFISDNALCLHFLVCTYYGIRVSPEYVSQPVQTNVHILIYQESQPKHHQPDDLTFEVCELIT